MFVKFVKDDKVVQEVSISPEMIPFPTDIVVLRILLTLIAITYYEVVVSYPN